MLTLGWRAQQMRQQVGQAAPASSQRIDASISNTYTWPSLSHLCRALLLVISMVRQSLGGIQPSITRKLDLSAGQACTKHLFLNELHPTLDTIDPWLQQAAVIFSRFAFLSDPATITPLEHCLTDATGWERQELSLSLPAPCFNSDCICSLQPLGLLGLFLSEERRIAKHWSEWTCEVCAISLTPAVLEHGPAASKAAKKTPLTAPVPTRLKANSLKGNWKQPKRGYVTNCLLLNASGDLLKVECIES